MVSLRLNGPAFLWRVHSGLKATEERYDCPPNRLRCALRPRASTVEEEHVRVLRACLIERIPDPLMIVSVRTAGERDARARWQKHLRLGTFWRSGNPGCRPSPPSGRGD
jgi:hypothetical protein